MPTDHVYAGYNALSGDPMDFFSGIIYHHRHAVWSPAGNDTLIYTESSGTSEPAYALYTVTFPDAVRRLVAEGLRIPPRSRPSWSPDATQVVIWNATDDPDLFAISVVDIASGAVTPLLTDTLDNVRQEPIWQPR